MTDYDFSKVKKESIPPILRRCLKSIEAIAAEPRRAIVKDPELLRPFVELIQKSVEEIEEKSEVKKRHDEARNKAFSLLKKLRDEKKLMSVVTGMVQMTASEKNKELEERETDVISLIDLICNIFEKEPEAPIPLNRFEKIRKNL